VATADSPARAGVSFSVGARDAAKNQVAGNFLTVFLLVYLLLKNYQS